MASSRKKKKKAVVKARKRCYSGTMGIGQRQKGGCDFQIYPSKDILAEKKKTFGNRKNKILIYDKIFWSL